MTDPWYYREPMSYRTYDPSFTSKDYYEMLEDQGGKCAICQRPPGKKRLHVDHDHETGYVRGLLCDGCNRQLAWYETNRGRVTKYLREI